MKLPRTASLLRSGPPGPPCSAPEFLARRHNQHVTIGLDTLSALGLALVPTAMVAVGVVAGAINRDYRHAIFGMSWAPLRVYSVRRLLQVAAGEFVECPTALGLPIGDVVRNEWVDRFGWKAHRLAAMQDRPRQTTISSMTGSRTMRSSGSEVTTRSAARRRRSRLAITAVAAPKAWWFLNAPGAHVSAIDYVLGIRLMDRDLSFGTTGRPATRDAAVFRHHNALFRTLPI